jgi:hypothetical protein
MSIHKNVKEENHWYFKIQTLSMGILKANE